MTLQNLLVFSQQSQGKGDSQLYSDYQYKSIYNEIKAVINNLRTFSLDVIASNERNELVELFWKQLLKFYREITFNKYNRIDSDPRRVENYLLYTEICNVLLPFMEYELGDGLGMKQFSKFKNEWFNIILQIMSNFISSRFIDTRIMERMGDTKIKVVLEYISGIISTIPAENIYVGTNLPF